MVNLIKTSKIIKTPSYVKEFYGNLYQNEERSRFYDNDKLLWFLTLGQRPKLVADVVKEISTNSKVLQIGCTFGSQIEAVSKKIGPYGSYDIIDVCPEQLKRCRGKNVYQKTNLEFYDGTRHLGKKYDVIICFMLLHELPMVTKGKIINNALDSIVDGGKVIFVDYFEPSKWNPLWFFIRAFNRIYQPFAEDLWKFRIRSYATKPKDFSWRRKLYLKGMYQKVVAIRRVPGTSEKLNNPNFY